MFRSRSMMGAALCALAAPLVLGSCVADSVSLRVSCSIVPEDDCTYTEGGACYLDGRMNLTSINDRYHAVLLVSNGLKPRARDVPPQSEPNGVIVNEVEVLITDSAGRKPAFPGSLPNPFTVQATGEVKPGEDGIVGAELLPRPYIGALRTLSTTVRSVRLSVIARGKTWGGVEVESGAWPWTVQLVAVNEDPMNEQCISYMDDVCSPGQDRWAYACDPALVEDDQ
jgi:hypothetical protein